MTSAERASPGFSDALDGTAPTATSSLFPDLAPNISPPEHQRARRVFLAARTLKAAGELTAVRLKTALGVLGPVDPRVVVTDPFVDSTGPLRVLGAALAEG